MATNLLEPRQLASPIIRQYINLTGVDFHNEASRVALNRSPDALNVYKNYRSSGECIETRPGWELLGTYPSKINGLYFFEHGSGYIVVVHAGTKLYKWNNFPSSDSANFQLLYSSMANNKSQFVVFMNVLYILDGTNYLQYDGTILQSVTANAYVPTTTIGRSPSGGGEMYQPVNVLSSSRINQFTGDGTSTDYVLDAVSIDSVDKVVVDGVTLIATTDYTVNLSTGVVSFTTPPSHPADDMDNVFITFSKTVSGYTNRIQNCTLMTVFDNRIFFSGNATYKNAVFHSKLENPAYISDLDYYQDGLDESPIKSFCVGNNVLWVFKQSNQQNNTIYYHVPTLDTVNGRIYPSAQGNVSIGCNSECCNFNDDIVFMTEEGLEGVSGYIASEQILNHRSTLVDARMTNEEDFDKCSFTEWQGYLLCLINGKIYLADSRQLFRGIESKEYEWYYWDGLTQEDSKLVLLREYKGNLYLRIF